MKFINPSYKVNETKNLFTLRKEEYENLESTIREILKPAEELGFVITDFGIKESKFSSGELYRTLKRNLVIKLQKNGSEIDLSMMIPKLINDNYLVIGGRKKIPLFQLFDIPFVTRGKTIKMRTNVASLMVFEEKEFPHIYISIFGKKVPLALVMFSFFGYEKIGQMFDFSKVQFTEDDYPNLKIYDKFLAELKDYYESSEDYTRDDFIKETGKYFSNFDYRVKGEDLVYGLDLILKTDVMSAKFFTTGSVLGDLIEVMKRTNRISIENEKIVEETFLRGDLVKFAKIFPTQEMMKQDFTKIYEFVKRSTADIEAEHLREAQ